MSVNENKEVTTVDQADSEASRRIKKAMTFNRIINLIPLVSCVVLGLLYVILATSQGFDLAKGFRAIVSDATLVALVATGATCIFAAGSFDLSLGSNMLVSAVLGGLVIIATKNIFLGLLTSIFAAIFLSVLNSTLASIFKLPVFIMTVVMMNVYTVIATLLITKCGDNSHISVPMALVEPLNNTWFRIGLLAGFEIFTCFFFYITKLGRRQKFLGGNRSCSELSGIKTKTITIISFALAGVGIGLAAFSMIVYTPTLSATSGSSVGMNMLIALVFGGMVMSGGPRSKMYAALVGAFSMSFLDALLNIFVEGDWYLQIVKCVLFVVVVYLVSLGKKNKLLER